MADQQNADSVQQNLGSILLLLPKPELTMAAGKNHRIKDELKSIVANIRKFKSKETLRTN